MPDTLAASRRLTGAGIGQGVAIGTVLRAAEPFAAPHDEPSRTTPDEERGRVVHAVHAVAGALRLRAEQAGGAAEDVLDAQAMMVEDESLAATVDELVAAGKTAERAVFEACAAFAERLRELGGYLGDRAGDLNDIADRLIAELNGMPAPGIPQSDRPFVLVARDLAPAETAMLDLDQVLAFVTVEGGPTSHTAILAREKSVVAVVGCTDAAALRDGDEVIVDAAAGTVMLTPTVADLAEAAERIAERERERKAPHAPGALADGTPVPLLVNLGSTEVAEAAVAAGAEGVGLFRTEFLFLDARLAPTIEEQRKQYVRLLSAFPGKKVVVRVLDAGADKPLTFLNDTHEDNPALGVRGLRALRTNEDILREQLSALACADAETDADLWVMAPMVATVEEASYFTVLAKEYGIRTAGVMVEVPSAALTADRILRHADFASIGTNDLTQYTLAADRLLGAVAHYQSPWHPAVLRLIAEVGAAGADLGKPVGVCGEAAADPLLAVVLVGLGAGSLSMSPAALTDVRAALRRYTLDQARLLARRALHADDAADARRAVEDASAAMTRAPARPQSLAPTTNAIRERRDPS